MTIKAKLELYHFESCPYCAKVRKYIDANGLKSEIQYFDIHKDKEAYKRLLAMTGDEQVPCLAIDGKPMLESDDIIHFLGDKFKK